MGGDISENYGSWELISSRDGEGTLALYRLYSDLKGGSAIARYILSKQPALEIALRTSAAALLVNGMKVLIMTPPQKKKEREKREEYPF